MDLHNRCPECGQRLKTNYCHICMRKVSFGGVKQSKYREPWENKDGSSAHRMEKDHECISFEKEKKVSRIPKPSTSKGKPKPQLLAIILALLSIIPVIFNIAEDFTGADSVAVPEPAVNIHDGFVPAGDPGAENVPKVTPGEIYNENGIRLTVDAAGLRYGDYSIFLTIYNETDHNISVSADQISVNGYMFPYSMYQDVKAGRSEQTSLTFYDFELEKIGIEKVGKVEFILDIYDEFNYESTRKLLAIETDYPIDYSAMTGIYGTPLYNDEDLTLILQDIDLDGSGDCKVSLYMQNHSQNTINLYSETALVNGEEASCFVWQVLRPNTCAVDDAYIYHLNDLDIQSLEEIKEITLGLDIEFMDDFELLETRDESVTFNPGEI